MKLNYVYMIALFYCWSLMISCSNSNDQGLQNGISMKKEYEIIDKDIENEIKKKFVGKWHVSSTQVLLNTISITAPHEAIWTVKTNDTIMTPGNFPLSYNIFSKEAMYFWGDTCLYSISDDEFNIRTLRYKKYILQWNGRKLLE